MDYSAQFFPGESPVLLIFLFIRLFTIVISTLGIEVFQFFIWNIETWNTFPEEKNTMQSKKIQSNKKKNQ